MTGKVVLSLECANTIHIRTSVQKFLYGKGFQDYFGSYRIDDPKNMSVNLIIGPNGAASYLVNHYAPRPEDVEFDTEVITGLCAIIETDKGCDRVNEHDVDLSSEEAVTQYLEVCISQ